MPQYQLDNGPTIASDQELNASELNELQEAWDDDEHTAFHETLIELGCTASTAGFEP